MTWNISHQFIPKYFQHHLQINSMISYRLVFSFRNSFSGTLQFQFPIIQIIRCYESSQFFLFSDSQIIQNPMHQIKYIFQQLNLVLLQLQFKILVLKLHKSLKIKITQEMQKWQQKRRQRFHESIIQNVRPTIKINENLGKSRQKIPTASSRTKQVKTCHPNSFLPFVKILCLFQLQKYSNLLIEHGFPHKLADKRSIGFIDQILDNVEQIDRQKFLSLMNTLAIMSKDLQRNAPLKIKSQHHLKKQKTRTTNNLPPSSSNLRQSEYKTGSSKKAQKNTMFKVRLTSNFKSPAYQITQPVQSSRFLLSRPTQSTSIMRQAKQNQSYKSTIKQQQIRERSMKNSRTPKRHKVKNSFDDACITHDFKHSKKGTPTSLTQGNKIIQRLMQKLQKLNPQHKIKQKKQQNDINLQLQKIKKMYLSFDSGTLTSNIGNIDLEEIVQCFVEEIYGMINQESKMRNNESNLRNNESNLRNCDSKMRNNEFNIRNNEPEIRNNESKVNRSNLRTQRPNPDQKYIKLQNKEEIQYLLKQSLVFEPIQQLSQHKINPQILFNRLKDIRQPIQNLQLIRQSIRVSKVYDNQSQIDSTRKRDNSNTKSISLSSSDHEQQISEQDFGADYEIQSFVEDLSCFDNKLEGSMKVLQKQDIKNFVQLVVMAGKMEKQMPIISYMYVKKLLATKIPHPNKLRLSLNNWRNIVLVTLIQASKIWDDTSLQNHSFSKVLKPYTTYEINRLEKYFLYYIDYQLTIDQKEYCESYFKLRTHSQKAQKTAHLMSLDIKTIQNIQAMKPGIKKKQLHLRQFYRKKMDKSF